MSWEVSQSIALELDIALTTAGGDYYVAGGLPPDVLQAIQGLPADWLAARDEMLSGAGDSYISLLEVAAGLAGVVTEADYGKATLAIRQLRIEDALKRMESWNPPLEDPPGKDLSPADRLVESSVGRQLQLYRHLGFPAEPASRMVVTQRRALERILPILAGGRLNARFWHWLDRFYYGYYAPWRETRIADMEAGARQAALALGGEQSDSTPDLEWLPSKNPLVRLSQLNQAVKTGQVHTVFWVEPFGLPDSWLTIPGDPMPRVISSFSAGKVLYENFYHMAEEVAGRAQALADPTRLIILRIIRHFGLMNTEIAEYLDISRPTVSVHAKILREAGLIKSRQEGRAVRHEINPAAVRQLFRELESFLDLPEEPEG